MQDSAKLHHAAARHGYDHCGAVNRSGICRRGIPLVTPGPTFYVPLQPEACSEQVFDVAEWSGPRAPDVCPRARTSFSPTLLDPLTTYLLRGRGGAAPSALASRQCEPGLIPGGVVPALCEVCFHEGSYVIPDIFHPRRNPVDNKTIEFHVSVLVIDFRWIMYDLDAEVDLRYKIGDPFIARQSSKIHIEENNAMKIAVIVQAPPCKVVLYSSSITPPRPSTPHKYLLSFISQPPPSSVLSANVPNYTRHLPDYRTSARLLPQGLAAQQLPGVGAFSRKFLFILSCLRLIRQGGGGAVTPARSAINHSPGRRAGLPEEEWRVEKPPPPPPFIVKLRPSTTTRSSAKSGKVYRTRVIICGIIAFCCQRYLILADLGKEAASFFKYDDAMTGVSTQTANVFSDEHHAAIVHFRGLRAGNVGGVATLTSAFSLTHTPSLSPPVCFTHKLGQTIWRTPELLSQSLGKSCKSDMSFASPSLTRNPIQALGFLTVSICVTRKSTGRPPVSEATVERVRESFVRSSPKSTAITASREWDISHSTVWKILRKFLRFRPYRLQLFQALKSVDKAKRLSFCEHMQIEMETDGFSESLVFSDEATFHMLGKMHKHNQDGASPHFNLGVKRELNRRPPNRWIERGGCDDSERWCWPPRSPDLTPCDFFLWGFVRQHLYRPLLPPTIQDLSIRIAEGIASVDRPMLQHVWQELDYRLYQYDKPRQKDGPVKEDFLYPTSNKEQRGVWYSESHFCKGRTTACESWRVPALGPPPLFRHAEDEFGEDHQEMCRPW
ncbi:hypothetical protein PR048_025033 [Dryococelus australis]|uniref:Uncharacterized protein n=1 Tax=Dryococelus australis TaxID=614101 RepID=A0ABQ9GQB5_9NEOP|nr:hypothetical protein PR048_025033 [Dryococelus australis]